MHILIYTTHELTPCFIVYVAIKVQLYAHFLLGCARVQNTRWFDVLRCSHDSKMAVSYTSVERGIGKEMALKSCELACESGESLQASVRLQLHARSRVSVTTQATGRELGARRVVTSVGVVGCYSSSADGPQTSQVTPQRVDGACWRRTCTQRFIPSDPSSCPSTSSRLHVPAR
jgi:hypothetical protein